MKIKKLLLLLLIISYTVACNNTTQKNIAPKVIAVNAMRNVMWNGQLQPSIQLDTISNKTGLYGLGPISYLTGEIVINNGTCYSSKVAKDSSLVVTKTYNLGAPFFVYSNVTNWQKTKLPAHIKTIKQLEHFIDSVSTNNTRPFPFKLEGSINSASIHVQNLPPGSKVSSPTEGHVGQVSYKLSNEDVLITGFFSTQHKGVFTHHDSFVHMHLLTKDETKMGHLDAIDINNLILYLPDTTR